MTERARALAWPLFAVSGLLIVAFSLVSWGDSSQGLNSKISGVGRVSVPGAAPEDVAFLEAHTQRPGLVTIILGAVIAAVAAVGWWRRRLRPIALSVIGLAAVGAAVAAGIVIADPSGRLLDDAVTSTLDLAPGEQILQLGYGVIAVLVVAILVVLGVVVSALAVVRSTRLTSTRRDRTPATPPG
ncbi:Uncharacterised protein [Mycobacteroides abscessus subsp. abscessus]|nr:Uncharacterised protein [Mycobacteroides abscessus subsp. abscessus]